MEPASMPKLFKISAKIGKEIMDIIKNHVSLNGKIIQIHYTKQIVLRFSRLHVRTESNKHFKIYSKIHPQIDINFMLKKMMQTTQKSSQNEFKRELITIQKLIKG